MSVEVDAAVEQESELHMRRVGLRWVVLWDLTRKTINMSSTRRPSPTLKVGLQCLYTILLYSGYFSGWGKFSWFSWLRGEPRNFYPRNSAT